MHLAISNSMPFQLEDNALSPALERGKMNVLIVCGSPWCNLDSVFSAFQAAGVKSPAPAEQNFIPSMDAWHDRFFAGRHETFQQLHPGKAWEQAAAGIFLTNWDKPLWGWADSRSTWLLDYWQQFDPQICFVLAYANPERSLGQAIAESADSSLDAERIVATWLMYSREMLRFYNRNRDRCILIDVHECGLNPAGLATACEEAMGVILEGEIQLPKDERFTANDLATLLARELLSDFPEASELHKEIEACLTHWPQDGESDRQADEHDYRSMIHGAIGELKKLVFSVESAKEAAERQAAELSTQREAAERQAAELRAQREAAERQSAESKTKIEKLTQDYQKLNQDNQKLVQDSEKLKKSAADKDKQHETEKKQLRETSKREQEDLKQENELLLLQLHQVQEELEHYFLQHQEAQNNLKEQERRWNRFFTRHPDYCDWDTIEVLPQDQPEAGAMVRWRIKGLVAGNRTLPDFEVTTLVHGGQPALLIHRDGDNHPLLRWPALAKTHKALVVQPHGQEKDQALRWGILNSLTPSDWHFVLTICSALTDFLRVSSSAPTDKPLPDISTWVPIITGLRQQLLQMPPAWRYDSVKLKRQQVNPDYEHLWFVLNNVEFGKRRWPTFEFRLSAALIQPGKFSVHPKLEFPQAEDGTRQFEKWFAESHDDFGPKFELRFALDSQAMDLNVWNALSSTDQLQMTLLTGGIPALLSSLESDGAAISRPWKDWQQLAAGTFTTLMKNLHSEPPAPEEKPAEMAPPPPPVAQGVQEKQRPAKPRQLTRKRR